MCVMPNALLVIHGFEKILNDGTIRQARRLFHSEIFDDIDLVNARSEMGGGFISAM